MSIDIRETKEWAQVRNALKFYSDTKNWHKDDWGVTSVLNGHKRGEGYGNPHVKAIMALHALERMRRELES